jgi:predicted RNA-binding protein with PUA domain
MLLGIVTSQSVCNPQSVSLEQNQSKNDHIAIFSGGGAGVAVAQAVCQD